MDTYSSGWTRPGRRTLCAALVLFLLCAASGLRAAADPETYPAGSRIHWQAFEPALFPRARTENRLLFLYFHGQWCSWCRDFQDHSLEHDDNVQALQTAYIPVLIDLDRRRDLFTRYGGRGLPFVVILDGQDTLRSRFTGHVAAADLHRVLTEGRRQLSLTGREVTPAETAIDTAPALLDMLDQVYDPRTRRLSGTALFGTLSKRPQPWTLAFLLRQEDWQVRMPGLLEQLVEDLHDPVDGGFFFFHDPDQRDPARARETSKRLDQNAAFLWLFADAYARYGDPVYRDIAERSLGYLRRHLWDDGTQRFLTSQHADPRYYALPAAARRQHPPPTVDRTSYADASGQAIAALLRAAEVLEDPALLAWAGTALDSLDRQLRTTGGYRHALPPEGPAELEGYLPAQVWPAIAWHLYGRTRDPATHDRTQEHLEWIARYYHAPLGGYRERKVEHLEPWVETRTQAALAWWLQALPPARLAAAGIDLERVLPWLTLAPGDDPDDLALGFWHLEDR